MGEKGQAQTGFSNVDSLDTTMTQEQQRLQDTVEENAKARQTAADILKRQSDAAGNVANNLK